MLGCECDSPSSEKVQEIALNAARSHLRDEARAGHPAVLLVLLILVQEVSYNLLCRLALYGMLRRERTSPSSLADLLRDDVSDVVSVGRDVLAEGHARDPALLEVSKRRTAAVAGVDGCVYLDAQEPSWGRGCMRDRQSGRRLVRHEGHLDRGWRRGPSEVDFSGLTYLQRCTL